ncbi:serine/threonine-protein kinase CDG1-like isoform X3 [Helianthus annuus]|nr:serine/threonine-protein kinase CDG1-like isoform X3 [Helianthus annuus]
MEEFDDLKIPLKDVILATDSFATNNRIGCGGFGSVYKGELSRPEGLITVACKRLDRRFGQGNVEFSKEIVTLSKCKHENLVSLLHFCIEDDERILVYEYASRGSLDRYLSDPSLTWTQRLKICVGVAHALNYLHDPPTYTHQRIIHRDIKSSNILLDEEWNAKVSDFGLSKFGPANQPQTYLVSDAVGTLGYCDPLYWETGILSKESDVYSFGVVLHEVMCGTLCCEYCNGRLISILVPMWKKRFEEQRLDGIINHGLQKHMDPGSLNTFSTIAYQCLKTARKERPTMAKIVEQLNIALEQQEIFEDIVKRMNFERMRRIADFAVSSLSYVTQGQLLFLFMKGMLLDDGKTWFSVNKKGQHCELISSSKCVSASHTVFSAPGKLLHSRFQDLFKYRSTEDLRLTVVTQFLSPNVTYIINLVYKCDYPHNRDLRIPFKYKLEEMREYSTSCVAHVGEDGWQRTELFQFTSIKNEHYFDIHFLSELTGQEDRSYDIFSINIEGVEFCPVDFEKDENKVDNMQQPTDIDWGKRLPDEYAELIATTYSAYGISRKNAYFLLREGFLTNSEQ